MGTKVVSRNALSKFSSSKIVPTQNSMQSWATSSAGSSTLKKSNSEDSLDKASFVSIPIRKLTAKKFTNPLLHIFKVFNFVNCICCAFFVHTIIIILFALLAFLVAGSTLSRRMQANLRIESKIFENELRETDAVINTASAYLNNGRLSSITIDQLSPMIHPLLDAAGASAFVVSKTGTDFILMMGIDSPSGKIYKSYTTDAFSGNPTTGAANQMNSAILGHNFNTTGVEGSVITFYGSLIQSSSWFVSTKLQLSFTLSERELLCDDGSVRGIWNFKLVSYGGDDWVFGVLKHFDHFGNTLKNTVAAETDIILVHPRTQIVYYSTFYPMRGIVGYGAISSLERNFISNAGNFETNSLYSSMGKLIHIPEMSDSSIPLRLLTIQTENKFSLGLMSHPLVILFMIFPFIIAFIICIPLLLSFYIPFQLLISNMKRVSRIDRKIFTAAGKKFPIFKWWVFDEIRELNLVLEKTYTSTDLLRRYAPVDLVRYVLEKKDSLTLGMSPTKMTILFSDLVEFTNLASRLHAEKFVSLLSDYFESMIQIIENNNGHLDKLVGDAIMCLFVPSRFRPCVNHELMASKTVLEMQEGLQTLNEQWRKSEMPTLKMRIGVATGDSMIGNIGSSDHFSFTAISNAVNLSSRLESLNTYFGTHQLIDHTTYVAVKKSFVCYWVDSVAIKGRNTGMHVYELVKKRSEAKKSELKIEEQLLSIRNALVDRKFSKVISSIESLSDYDNAPQYIGKLRKRTADLVLVGEARDVDISLFMTSK